MKAQHTPGPWVIDPSGTAPLGVIADTEDGDGICEGFGTGPEAEANARLIKAAPDLLAALETISGECAQHVGEITRLGDHFTPQDMIRLLGMFREDARAAIAKAKGGAS